MREIAEPGRLEELRAGVAARARAARAGATRSPTTPSCSAASGERRAGPRAQPAGRAALRSEPSPCSPTPRNLEAITPPWLGFRIVSPRPIELAEGALIEYRLRLHGIPVRWRTRIEVWEPPRRFVDVQLSGPYALWHHTHELPSRRRGSDPGPRPGPLPGRLRSARSGGAAAVRAPGPRADLRLSPRGDRGAGQPRGRSRPSSSLTGRSSRRLTSPASPAPSPGPATSTTSRAGKVASSSPIACTGSASPTRPSASRPAEASAANETARVRGRPPAQRRGRRPSRSSARGARRREDQDLRRLVSVEDRAARARDLRRSRRPARGRQAARRRRRAADSADPARGGPRSARRTAPEPRRSAPRPRRAPRAPGPAAGRRGRTRRGSERRTRRRSAAASTGE